MKQREQMNTWDWMVAIMYVIVTLAFVYFHTEVAIWVWLFVNLREMFKERDHKTIGNPNVRKS